MKFTIKWLKEYLDSSANFEQIIDALESLGLPCENVIKAYPAWSQIEIVKIIEKNAHPNADKLNIYKILKKDGTQLQIVCGDKSLEIGNFVPYACENTIIPSNNMQIKIAKIRGIESFGMLCSAKELMLPIEEAGVMRCFEEDFGLTIAQAYEDEGIIEMETTPNKGDMLSIKGIARALSFLNLGKLKNIEFSSNNCANENIFEIKSEQCHGLSCMRFSYQPQKTNYNIIKRLQLTGIGYKGIDVIDLANYIAHELGQPMHIYDANKIKGKLIIKNLENETEFTSLKGEKINLEKNTLTICDEEKILSWPGIIGSNNSKAEETSKDFIIESGIFEIDSIQRRKNKIITDSSKRFEYGIDPLMPETILNAFLYKLGVKAISQQHKKFTKAKKIDFDIKFIEKFLGKKITQEQLEAKLKPRGYKFEGSLIEIPSYKYFDIHTPNCIVEEFAIGEFEKIESINLSPMINKNLKHNNNTLNEIAINNGFFETVNFSITSKENEEFQLSIKNRAIKNATNNNYSFLRGSLIPNLLKIAQMHINNNQTQNKFFEHGFIYGEFENKQKTMFVAIAPDHKSLLEIFYDYIEFNQLKLPKINEIQASWAQEGISFSKDNKIIAQCGKIKQNILKDFELEEYFAIEIENLEKLENKTLNKPSQFPIFKDISFELPENFASGKIIELLKNEYEFEVFDIYPSSKINIKRNLGLRFKFNEETTLTKQEILEKIEKINHLIKTTFNL